MERKAYLSKTDGNYGTKQSQGKPFGETKLDFCETATAGYLTKRIAWGTSVLKEKILKQK